MPKSLLLATQPACLARSWHVGRLEAAEAREDDIAAALSGTQAIRIAADKIFIWPLLEEGHD
jgi:hypothetical protein